MDAIASCHVRVRRKTHGPFTADQLRELVRSGAIDGATEVAATADGPWLPLQTSAFAAVLRPPRPAFERVNDNASAPIDLHALIAAANRPPAGTPPPVGAADARAASTSDVHGLLRLNLSAEKARGLHRLPAYFRRPSRRRRDYLVALAAIGTLILLVLLGESYVAVQLQVLAAKAPEQFWPLLGQVLFHSPILAWGFAAFAAHVIGLGWVMFFVMDDY